MGWAVDCEGADLIRALRATEDSVLGRRYALYIIALATEIDDQAIKWLSDYGRSIDSLTGPAVAFIVFYNSAKCYAHADNGPPLLLRLLQDLGPRIDAQGTTHVFKKPPPTEGREIGKADLATIDVPSKALDGSSALTSHVRGRIRFPDEAFVRSMTYESDSVARFLGISPKELPCFVFIDDPENTEYHTLPMKGFDGDLMMQMRQVIGSFYEAAGETPYLELIERWDSLHRRMLALRQEHIIIEERLRAEIHGDFRNKELDQIAGSSRYLKNLRRARKGLQHFLSTVHETPPGADISKIKKFFSHRLSSLVSKSESAWAEPDSLYPADRIKSALSVLEHRIRGAEGKTETVQLAVNKRLEATTASRRAAATERIAKCVEEIGQIERAIDDVKHQLSDMDRPRIESVFNKLKWGTRRKLVASATTHAAEQVGKRVDTIIKALEFAMKAFGSHH
jgi:hypothetical protein